MEGLCYLLEANLYLSVFYVFYRTFLSRHTFYSLNRYYLISVVLLSYVLPLLQVGYFYELLGWSPAAVTADGPGTASGEDYQLLTGGLKVCYIAGAGFLAWGLILRIAEILRLAFRATKHVYKQVAYLELHPPEIAFSFFNLLFINPSAADKDTILKHEMVHIRQAHSADVLLFELLHVLNWFNPVVWLMRTEIKLVHEYIADEVSSANPVVGKHEYALLLIQYSFGTGSKANPLSNQLFNSSLLKRRINMLNKRKSTGRARLRFLLTLPVVLGMLFASTVAISKDYRTIDLYPVKFKPVIVGSQDTTKRQPAAKKRLPPPPPVEPRVEQVSTPKKSKVKDAKRMPPPVVVQVRNPKRLPPPPPPLEPGVKNQHTSKAEYKKRYPAPPTVEPAPSSKQTKAHKQP